MVELIVIADKHKDSTYCIPQPEGWEFRDEDHAETGEHIVVKVKKDGEKLRITEVEGIPVGKTEEPKDDRVPYIPDDLEETEED